MERIERPDEIEAEAPVNGALGEAKAEWEQEGGAPEAEPIAEPVTLTGSTAMQNRMKLPMAVLLVFAIGMAVAVNVIKQPEGAKGEPTLHKLSLNLGDWGGQKYEMDKASLDELKPDEYAAIQYRDNDGNSGDLTIIAGSHTGAFHNPEVCFRAQQWEFTENAASSLAVPGMDREIPIKRVGLNHRITGQKAVGLYFYKTPYGLFADTTPARIWLFFARVLGVQQKSYFVRVLVLSSGGNKEKDFETLEQFAIEVLESTRETNPELLN